jgi:glycosyltransferase involved in cell wall biosynthesis
MKKISLLIPAYNEEETLNTLYTELCIVIDGILNYEFEIFFINDGSSDGTVNIMQNLQISDNRVNYISLSRNFGKEIAMIAGLDYISGDAVILMDADLQDPPSLMPEMIKYWEEGYDDVYAKRRTREGETWFKRVTSHIFYKILQKLTQIPLQEDTGDFRLLDKSAIESLKMMREKQRYTKGMFSWIGFNKKEIIFDRKPRVAGSTKWNYIKLFNLALEGVTSFTTFPLRIASIIGIIVSIFSIIYMFIILIRSLIWKDPVQGYPSMMVTILFLGGVQLVSLGIIGEYVGRIFNETKHRPLYIINEHNNKKIYDGGKM